MALGNFKFCWRLQRPRGEIGNKTYDVGAGILPLEAWEAWTINVLSGSYVTYT